MNMRDVFGLSYHLWRFYDRYSSLRMPIGDYSFDLIGNYIQGWEESFNAQQGADVAFYWAFL